MTIEELDATISDEQLAAMDAIFQLHDALEKGLTIADLVQVIDAAVKDGLPMLQIGLTMASHAARLVEEKRASP